MQVQQNGQSDSTHNVAKFGQRVSKFWCGHINKWFEYVECWIMCMQTLKWCRNAFTSCHMFVCICHVVSRRFVIVLPSPSSSSSSSSWSCVLATPSSLDNLAICLLWLQQCYNDVCLFRPISCVHKLKDSGGRSPKWGSGQWTRPWSCEVKCQVVSRRKEHSEAWWKLAEIQVSSEPWRFWFGDFVSQLFNKGCKGYQGIVF